jgi:hypothetical protein
VHDGQLVKLAHAGVGRVLEYSDNAVALPQGKAPVGFQP